MGLEVLGSEFVEGLLAIVVVVLCLDGQFRLELVIRVRSGVSGGRRRS